MNDPVPTPVRALLELYAAELPEVRFPEVDLEVLKTTLGELERQTEAVAEAEAQLALAKRAQLEAFEALVAKSRRALAYAKVYAEDKAELLGKLEAIGLRAPKAAGAKPREPLAEARPAGPGEAVPREPATRALLSTSAEPEAEAVLDAPPDSAPKRRGRPPKAPATHAEAR